MKNLVILIVCLFSSVAKADSDGSGVRDQYDEMMKSSGKWGFISNSMYLTALLSFGGSYYAYNRSKTYKELMKTRDLSLHEQQEMVMWLSVMNTAGYAGGAGLVFGLIGTGASLQYENRAHQFAIDMKVHF